MSYYTAKDIQEILGISPSKAYQIIRKLNKELEEKGYITIAGRISKKKFIESYYCDAEELTTR